MEVFLEIINNFYSCYRAQKRTESDSFLAKKDYKIIIDDTRTCWFNSGVNFHYCCYFGLNVICLDVANYFITNRLLYELIRLQNKININILILGRKLLLHYGEQIKNVFYN